MFVVQILDEPVSHPQPWTTAGVDRDSDTLSAGMATSGSRTGWFSDLTGGVPFETMGDRGPAHLFRAVSQGMAYGILGPPDSSPPSRRATETDSPRSGEVRYAVE